MSNESWLMLVCNWPHSVGQNHFFVKMLFIRDSAIQKCSRTLCTVCKSENSVSCQSSGRCVIPSGCLAVQYINRPDDVDSHLDLPLWWEASNCSNLHTSRHFSSLSGRHSVFDQASDFLSKIKYGKIATTVRMTWIPVQTHYSLRKVRNSISTVRTPVYHGPDGHMTDMEIACIRLTVWTPILLVRTHESFIRKLLAADVRPSRRQGNTVWTQLSIRKDFQRNSQNFGRIVVRSDVLWPSSWRRPALSSQTLIWVLSL
jgi:hypothetical protein